MTFQASPLNNDSGVSDSPTSNAQEPGKRLSRYLNPALIFFLVAIACALLVGRYSSPTWTVEEISLDVAENEQGQLHVVRRGSPVYLDDVVHYDESLLRPEMIAQYNTQGTTPEVMQQFAITEKNVDGKSITLYLELLAKSHWGWWSLLPAAVAVALCWITREPLISLFGGIVVGAFLLGDYDIANDVLIDNLATESAAGVLLLYLWLLGGLLGVWNRTGAAQAFADLMTRKFVRGPRTAKLVAWSLGVIFFQGGTVSTVLVGTTVKPLADKERVSHEELAYIVDSTASPIASQLAFNAWPGYVQAFIFVAGVPWLATEADRITFFFKSVPFCFYAIFAVTFTFLLSIEKTPFIGERMRKAIRRSRETGQLDAPGAEPLSAKELHSSHVPKGYVPNSLDFFLPLLLLIGIAIGTFIASGTPRVRWRSGPPCCWPWEWRWYGACVSRT